jgi:hypothetical protein
MSFEQQIQQWVAIDNQMKILNDNIKELRNKKNNISQSENCINTPLNSNDWQFTGLRGFHEAFGTDLLAKLWSRYRQPFQRWDNTLIPLQVTLKMCP